MKIVPTIAMAISLLLVAGVSVTADAQTVTPEEQAAAKTGDNMDSMTDGEVKKIDKDTGKITLKHGEIKNLDMPGMTMVFTVKDKSLLDKVQPGDKVKFHAISDNGKLMVTDVRSVK
ncbi:copper-binding protein (plasmid) [Ampullimonas aquatilis]|uniref:copper-binding protein n=1 Tax=Ampullimonas aquatilis TaxID=1341549 RepID=UPI003C75E148